MCVYIETAISPTSTFDHDMACCSCGSSQDEDSGEEAGLEMKSIASWLDLLQLAPEILCCAVQLRLQPDEAIYMKIVVKKPGLEMESIVSELDLSYKHRYGDTYIPDAYERLILDAIRGDQQHFVRRCLLSLLSMSYL